MKQILKEIDFEKLISELTKTTNISVEAYFFAKDIIVNSCLTELRADNFCVDLTQPKTSLNNIKSLDYWEKEQCKAFGKLYAKFSHAAAELLNKKQVEGIANNNDVQLILLKLPKQNDDNRKQVNAIKKSVENNQFIDATGNENWLTLQKFINTKKSNPMTSFIRTSQSVSVVLVTETNKVLLLKRAGGSGRAGSWGTLTGKIEQDETCDNTIAREVHEEINYLLGDKKAHYVGIAYTKNLGKDLTEQKKAVSYVDDCSYVYGILVNESELNTAIKLDSENDKWKLFTRDELNLEFATKSHNLAVHGNEVDTTEMHVALAKSLLVLDAAKNNFENIQLKKFNYPYTNSHGFFAHYQEKGKEAKPDIGFSSPNMTRP